jgi:hypothetical protein
VALFPVLKRQMSLAFGFCGAAIPAPALAIHRRGPGSSYPRKPCTRAGPVVGIRRSSEPTQLSPKNRADRPLYVLAARHPTTQRPRAAASLHRARTFPALLNRFILSGSYGLRFPGLRRSAGPSRVPPGGPRRARPRPGRPGRDHEGFEAL